ncbi:hypothetical protein [Ekhidna sp.]
MPESTIDKVNLLFGSYLMAKLEDQLPTGFKVEIELKKNFLSVLNRKNEEVGHLSSSEINKDATKELVRDIKESINKGTNMDRISNYLFQDIPFIILIVIISLIGCLVMQDFILMIPTLIVNLV